jgi:hypothetical protein
MFDDDDIPGVILSEEPRNESLDSSFWRPDVMPLTRIGGAYGT